MSQSRFSIVLVGVSALLRRPLVSRLRPAVFAARGSGGFRRSALPSASELPLGELVLLPSVSEIATRRVGLRAHRFRFLACAASGLPSAGWFCRLPFRRLPLGGLVFGLTASAFRYAPLRGCRSAGWFFCLPLRRLPLVRLVLPQGELAFGLTASAFRHAPLRSGRWASSFFRLPLRKLPLAG